MTRNFGQIERKVKIKKKLQLSEWVLNLSEENKKRLQLSKVLRKRIRKMGV